MAQVLGPPRIVDPYETAHLEVSWAAWLRNATIVDSLWEVPVGVTREADSFTTTMTDVNLLGFTLGKSIMVYNTVLASNGAKKRIAIVVDCRE